jgi:hypothetical protein
MNTHRNKKIFTFFLSILFFCYPHISFAGVLTIETQTSIQIIENQLEVTVKITNKGDEPAYNTQINLIVQDEKSQGAVYAKLDPGNSDINTFSKSLSGLAQGRYPLTVMVDFHDANRYPFSALAGLTFFLGKDVNGDLAISGDNITMDKEGGVDFHIKNMGYDSLNISASLSLPKEFSASIVKKSFQIDARSEKKLSFDISNFSARNDATYPVYCALEYDKNNIHYTSMANISIMVKVAEGWFRSLKWLWVGIVTILFVLLSCMGLSKRVKSFHH